MLKKAGIVFDSERARKAMSNNRKGINNSFFGKTHTEENRAKMRAIALMRTKSHRPAVRVEITDTVTGKTVVYSSMKKAAEALGVNRTTFNSRKHRDTLKLYKNRYRVVFKET
jgi:group I intron endonuclease